MHPKDGGDGSKLVAEKFNVSKKTIRNNINKLVEGGDYITHPYFKSLFVLPRRKSYA